MNAVQVAKDKRRLQQELLAATKECQTHSKGGSVLVKDGTRICGVIQEIIQYGARNNALLLLTSGHPPSMPNWLRTALNERSLQRQIQILLGSEELIDFYEPWAFIRDKECLGVLEECIRGLGAILFAISEIPNPKTLSTVNVLPPSAAAPSPVSKKPVRRKKRTPVSVVSFDEQDQGNQIPTSHIAVKIEAPVARAETDASESSLPTSENIPIQTPVTPAREETSNSRPSSPSSSIASSISSYSNAPRLQPFLSYHSEELVPLRREELSNAQSPSVHIPSANNHDRDSAAETASTISASSFALDDMQKLRSILDRETATVYQLKMDLAEEKRRTNDKQKMDEAKIEALERENEILRHQLRAGGDNEDSSQQERQLIQVSEMHGELLEFNTHLQLLLKAKDLEIQRLREELEELRGPSIAGNRIPVNIWIPSVFLAGGSGDTHHVYQVFFRIRDTEWNIYRRYSQFLRLHQEQTKLGRPTPPFPPKRHRGNKDSKFVEERRHALQAYLRGLIMVLLSGEENRRIDKAGLVAMVPFFGEQMQQQLKPRNRFFQQQPTYTGL